VATVDLELTDGRVTWVSVRNNWRRTMTVQDLEAAIEALLRGDAIGSAEDVGKLLDGQLERFRAIRIPTFAEIQSRVESGELSSSPWTAPHRDEPEISLTHLSSVLDELDRILTVLPTTRPEPSRPAEFSHRDTVTFTHVDGTIVGVKLAEDWAGRVPAQTLSETLTTAFSSFYEEADEREPVSATSQQDAIGASLDKILSELGIDYETGPGEPTNGRSGAIHG
jgi:hypothetical protein